MGTHDATQNGNGTLPLVSASDDPLAPYIQGLEQELAPLAARKAQLESELAEVLKSEARIKAGITALKSGAPKKTAAKTTAPGGSHDWVPAQATLDDVYAIFARAGEPITVRQAVDKAAGAHSSTTIKKAIDALRSEERLRLCGNASTPGSPKLYGVMQ